MKGKESKKAQEQHSLLYSNGLQNLLDVGIWLMASLSVLATLGVGFIYLIGLPT